MKCNIEGCSRTYIALGMCMLHYQRSKDGRDLTKPVRKHRPGEWGQWHYKDGYVCRKRIDRSTGKTELQLEHRAVMEEVLKRKLLPHENVHHINGVKDDNRPENLELWSTSQPKGQRVSDKIDWAVEILRLYKPEILESKGGGSASDDEAPF